MNAKRFRSLFNLPPIHPLIFHLILHITHPSPSFLLNIAYRPYLEESHHITTQEHQERHYLLRPSDTRTYQTTQIWDTHQRRTARTHIHTQTAPPKRNSATTLTTIRRRPHQDHHPSDTVETKPIVINTAQASMAPLRPLHPLRLRPRLTHQLSPLANPPS